MKRREGILLPGVTRPPTRVRRGTMKGAIRTHARLPTDLYDRLLALASVSPYSVNDLLVVATEKLLKEVAPAGSE